MLIDFTEDEEVNHWVDINDDVMGGISQSRIELSPTATAIFNGQLSLENNGGFASIRRRAENGLVQKRRILGNKDNRRPVRIFMGVRVDGKV